LRIALADVALAMAGNLGFLAEAQVNRVTRQRIGNYLYGGFGRDFGCKDEGRLMVVALTARHWRDLVAVTGTEAPVTALERTLGADFSLDSDRFEYREVLAGLIQRWFAARTTEDATAQLARTSVLWARYRTFTDVIDHLASPDGANPLMSVIDQAGVGKHLAPGLPLTLGGYHSPATAAPVLGQHTRSVLSEQLGLTSTEIDALGAAATVLEAEAVQPGKGGL
jgi:2-methylfumaryl-CoA isomerase